jgi:hypothetical protein
MLVAGNPMTRVKQSRAELENQLKEQIGFLITSCRLYDEANHAEAKRLAGSLRILFHETKNSRSLLGQLNLREIFWVDTAAPYDPENLVSHVALISIKFEPGRIPWLIPKGTPTGTLTKIDFNKWWSHPVIVSVAGIEKRFFSRQNLILNVANTDGGAHVDPELEEVYAELSRKNIVGFTVIKGEKKYPMLYPELPSLRQIAHEVILTLQEKVTDYFIEPYDSDIRIEPYGVSIDSGPQTEQCSVEIHVRPKVT